MKLIRWTSITLGGVAAIMAYSTVRVLCEFASCRPTAYLIPVFVLVALVVLGYIVEKVVHLIS